MSGKRCALLIATERYQNGAIGRLRAPSQDVARLSGVLSDPAIGGFAVETLIDRSAPEVLEGIARFFANRDREDLLLLYFSGHGIKDSRGRLFLGAANTQLQDLLSATAVPAAFVNERMGESRSRRKVLILDCCYSGAFAKGMVPRSGQAVGVGDCFHDGHGHAVLTASDATSYAFEGERVLGKAEPSVFTRVLVEGLSTGQADLDRDGHVTFDELAAYVSREVTARMPSQRPQKWVFGVEGGLRLARNPRPAASPLPQDIVDALADHRVWVRKAAVEHLAEHLAGAHPGLAVAAREALERLLDDDSKQVSTAAHQVLGCSVEGGTELDSKTSPSLDPVVKAPRIRPQVSRRGMVFGGAALVLLGGLYAMREGSGAAGDEPQAGSVSAPDPPGEVEARAEVPQRPFPPWAVDIGDDRYGLWADIKAGNERARLRWIEPGTFQMGSPEDEDGRDDDEAQHSVALTKGYWLGETEVTQALWQAVMGEDNPSHFKSPQRPVENVSWEDAQKFLTRLNGRIRGLEARLPTEAEWEYACRAGTTTSTYGGELKILGQRNGPVLGEIAWYGGNSGVDFDLADGWDSSAWDEKQYQHTKAGTRLVKRKAPNGWGLYDMLGNVWEWCSDWYGDYEAGALTDPSGPKGGSARVARGGSWIDGARYVRAAHRFGSTPEFGYHYLGFRIARGPSKASE